VIRDGGGPDLQVSSREEVVPGGRAKNSIDLCHSGVPLGVRRTSPGVFSSLQRELPQLRIIYDRFEMAHEASVEPGVVFILCFVN
jgi:hypothetical protein